MATGTRPEVRNDVARKAGGVANRDSSPRLRLRSSRREGLEPPGGTYVDGGWWPRSTDLRVELPPLLSTLRSAGYEIERVSYNLTFWDPAPRRLTISAPAQPTRLVKLGGFRTQNPNLVSLIDRTRRSCLDLFVIPPHTPAGVAEIALDLAATTGDRHTPAQILDIAHAPASKLPTSSAQDDEVATQRWDTDGGRRSGALNRPIASQRGDEWPVSVPTDSDFLDL